MTEEGYHITVIGIGAMGGGIARALLESPVSKTVVGYDRATDLVDAFFEESEVLGKAPAAPPHSLTDAITVDTKFIVLVLQNEPQCEQVCFGDEPNLLTLAPEGSCIILSSTVRAVWAQNASEKFLEKGIHFVDCPISGGPVRARAGDLTLMASGDENSLSQARPVLDAMGGQQQIYIIAGGAGMGSTAKMVHQLLAGVHIVVAAEAIALAAKAGLDVEQMYEIVNGAAGASWMFQDRGKRMMSSNEEEVKSQLQIFVKDLDIVYAEAKRLQSPVPIASAALQQFICGQSLGLSQEDDSRVVKVYESITGVPVAGVSEEEVEEEEEEVEEEQEEEEEELPEGDNVGEYWRMEDGQMEVILEVANEPFHKIVLSNEFVRALRVSFPPHNTTLAHRHAEDSLYFFLVEGGLDIVNHVKGESPACDCVDFGEIRYGAHKSEKPLIHKITNDTDKQVLVVDAEILKRPPVVAPIPLVAEKHELVKTRDKCRVYKLTLEPGESVTVSYLFFHLNVVLQPGTIEKEIAGPIRWTETFVRGDVAWKEPIRMMAKTNVGQTTFVEYIAEWR